MVLLLFDACSVKEDRFACPCSLTLSLIDDVPGNGMVMWSVDAPSYRDGGVLKYEKWPDGFRFSVPQGNVDVKMLLAGNSVDCDDNGIVIEEGRDCPYIYYFSKSVECVGNEALDTIELHKKYALLYCFARRGPSLKGGEKFVINGSVNGYTVWAEPREGNFRYEMEFKDVSVSGKVGCVSLPAQKDGSLRLDVFSPEGALLRSFALGEYILKSGYDWSADDLEDINIEVDLVNTSLWIYTSGKKTQYFDIELGG